MLLPAWTSPLPGAGCRSCSGHIELRLPADVSVRVIRHQVFPLPLFTYFEKSIRLLTTSHTTVLAGQAGYALASTSVPTAVPSTAKHVLHASCGIRSQQKLGRTAATRDGWSQLFAKAAESAPPPLPPLPSRGTSTRLPDLLGSEPAPGDFQDAQRQLTPGARMHRKQAVHHKRSPLKSARGPMGPS